MAGFLESNPMKGLRSSLTALSRFGMKYDDLLVKNSQAIGYIEGQLTGFNNAMGDDLMKATLALSDTTSSLKNKSIAFFQLEFSLIQNCFYLIYLNYNLIKQLI